MSNYREALSSSHFSHDQQLLDALRHMEREHPDAYYELLQQFPEIPTMCTRLSEHPTAAWFQDVADDTINGPMIDEEWSSWVTDAVEATGLVQWEDGEPYSVGLTREQADYADDFVTAYIVAALWSSIVTLPAEESPTGAEYTRNWDDVMEPDDVGPEAMAEIRGDAESFVADHWDDLVGIDAGQAGHDFALTRDHHGAGFWDRGLGEKGARLTDACRPYGGTNVDDWWTREQWDTIADKLRGMATDDQ